MAPRRAELEQCVWLLFRRFQSDPGRFWQSIQSPSELERALRVTLNTLRSGILAISATLWKAEREANIPVPRLSGP